MTEFSKGDIIKIEKGTEGQDDYKTAMGQVTRRMAQDELDDIRADGLRITKLQVVRV